jgi:hypothetical protein
MTTLETIERALHSPSPFDELRSLVKQLFADGQDDQQVYDLFESVRGQLRREGREVQEDVVMEVMDCLVGWCSPQQVLKREGGSSVTKPPVPPAPCSLPTETEESRS